MNFPCIYIISWIGSSPLKGTKVERIKKKSKIWFLMLICRCSTTWATPQALFHFNYLLDRVSQFCSGPDPDPWTMILLPKASVIARIMGGRGYEPPCLSYLLRWDLHNFLLVLAPNHDLPNPPSQKLRLQVWASVSSPTVRDS
jgi:hypothetical protein